MNVSKTPAGDIANTRFLERSKRERERETKKKKRAKAKAKAKANKSKKMTKVQPTPGWSRQQ